MISQVYTANSLADVSADFNSEKKNQFEFGRKVGCVSSALALCIIYAYSAMFGIINGSRQLALPFLGVTDS